MALIATESWTGADGSAWPAQWTTSVINTGGAATIQGNAGRLSFPTTGNYVYGTVAQLSALSPAADFDVTLDVAFSTLDESYFYLSLRSTTDATSGGSNNGVHLGIYPHNGVNSAGIGYALASTNTDDGAVSGDLAAGQWVAGVARRVRFRVVGTEVAVKFWDPASAEPSTWLYQGTDTHTSGLTGRLSVHAFGSNSQVPRYAVLDNLTLTNDGSTTGTAPAPTGTVAAALSGAGTLTASVAGSGVPAMPRQVSGAVLRVTAAGTKVYKYEVTTSDVANSQAFLYVPEAKANATSAKLVLAAHGLGDDPSGFMEQSGVTLPLLDLLADAGYVVITPAYGATMGNDDGQARMTRAYAYLTTKWATAGTVLFGFSMGGATSMVGWIKGSVPGIKGIQLVAPLVDFTALTDPPFPSETATAWAAYGATSDADFRAKTADRDPDRQPAATYSGIRLRINSSPDDTYPMRTGSLALLSLAQPVAAQTIDVPVTGGHGQPSEFVNPAAMVAFYENAVATSAGSVTAALSGAGSLTATVHAGAPAPAHRRGNAVLVADTGTGLATLDY